MKLVIIVSILLVYFPVIYFFKRKIIHTMAGEEVPTHLRWYEGAGYLITHSTDMAIRQKLARLQNQIRTAGIAGIFLFWVVVLVL